MLFLVAAGPYPHQIIKFFAHGCPRGIVGKAFRTPISMQQLEQILFFFEEVHFWGDKNKFLYYFLDTYDYFTI
jgi:hypothetical protein